MGRPKQTDKDFLKGMTWFRAVSVRADGASAYALEKRFDPHLFKLQDGKLTRSKKWDRYRDGKRLPSDLTPAAVVSRVEAAIPSTARWFRSPLWDAIDGTLKDRYDIERKLRSLADVSYLLFGVEKWSGGKQLNRLPISDIVFDALVNIASIDSFAAILLMAREAEVIASPELRSKALCAYRAFQPTVETMPEFAGIVNRLFWHIDLSIKHWSLLSPNQRMEIVIFSNPKFVPPKNGQPLLPHQEGFRISSP